MGYQVTENENYYDVVIIMKMDQLLIMKMGQLECRKNLLRKIPDSQAKSFVHVLSKNVTPQRWVDKTDCFFRIGSTEDPVHRYFCPVRDGV